MAGGLPTSGTEGEYALDFSYRFGLGISEIQGL